MLEYLIPAGPLICIVGIHFAMKAEPFIKNQLDIISGGSYNPLYDTLSIIHAHMTEHPDQWKFDKDFARFPKSGGAATITITKERDYDGLQISIADINNSNFMKLYGFFDKVFKKQIKQCFAFQSTVKVTTSLFPDKAHLLLTDSSKNEVNQDFYDKLNQSFSKVKSYETN